MFLSAFERPDFEQRTAIIFRSQRLTYGDIAAQARHIATGLQSRGVCQGDRVGLHFRNSDQLIACYLACYWSGAILVPLRYSESTDLIIPWCNRLSVKCVIADDHLVNRIASRINELTSTRMVVTPPGASAPTIVDAQKFQRVPNDGRPLFIVHTSGSTALPKAVMQDLDALNARTRALIKYLDFQPDDVCCVVNDFTHGFGLHTQAMPAWGVGAAVMLFDQVEFDAAQTISEAAKAGASIMGSNPLGLRRLLRAARDASELPRLRFALSATDKLPDDIALEWQEVFGAPLLEAYGSTEGCGGLFFNRLGDHEIGTVGRPLPGVRARIVGGDGNDMPDCQVGELWLASEFLSSGYWDDPETTQQAFGGGWFRTQDQFIRDPSGRYRFVGRGGNMIKHGGVLVSPFEIESALMRHPSVAQCVAIPVPSEEFGQDIEAFVALRSPVSGAELQRHAAETLSISSRPARYWSMPIIPETSTGKVLRDRAHYADAKPLT